MKAILISYNINSKKHLVTEFDGDHCLDDAHQFKVIMQDDFPESKGWLHCATGDKESAHARGERLFGNLDCLKR